MVRPGQPLRKRKPTAGVMPFGPRLRKRKWLLRIVQDEGDSGLDRIAWREIVPANQNPRLRRIFGNIPKAPDPLLVEFFISFFVLLESRGALGQQIGRASCRERV